MRWVWRGVALAVLAIGWLFIFWQNRFHVTAPTVFVCLGYLAMVATVYNLWQTGVTAVAGSDDDTDSTWAKPAGAVGELEREKRTLLKAIKEAEFDHQMGKLSKRDVDEMVKGYRARAIEVIKEIDRLGAGSAGSTRDQILREVRARLELETRSNKKAKQVKPGVDAAAEAKSEAKAATDASSEPATAAGSASLPAQAGEKPASKSKKNGKRAAEPAAAPGAAVDAAASPAGDVPVAGASPAATDDDASDDAAAAARDAADAALDDEAMNADSTTTVEPRRSESAKEAMP